jgi:uracil-DNA glycosylase family 4
MAEDLRGDVRELIAAFRTHLEARGRSGALGVPLAPSPRMGPAPQVVAASGSEPEAVATSRSEGGAGRLQAVRDELGDCTRCKLSGGRKNIVFGRGNPDADLVFVGEAPGADEDMKGEPFVGAAGQLLDKMIGAMGYGRDDVYICNVIKCRPPQNRNPEPDEVAACEPFLKKQLAALRPRMLVALGKFASQSLCGEQTPITRLRGNVRTYEGVPVMPTYHPAYLLRTPEAKREVWSDLQAVMASLAGMGVTAPGSAKG